MKRHTIIVMAAAVLLLSACEKSDEEKAKPMLAKIESLYNSGKYSAALDSITSLREIYPMAIEARRKSLDIWQKASLKMAQADVASTDLQLQAVSDSVSMATDRLQRNRLTVKRDSLKARYDAMCGVVRMIRMRQKER